MNKAKLSLCVQKDKFYYSGLLMVKKKSLNTMLKAVSVCFSPPNIVTLLVTVISK